MNEPRMKVSAYTDDEVRTAAAFLKTWPGSPFALFMTALEDLARKRAPVAACESWCGRQWLDDSVFPEGGARLDENVFLRHDTGGPWVYCTKDCRDAGRPLNPASPPAAPPVDDVELPADRFDCAECGNGVKVDEDGCCVHCGEDAVAVIGRRYAHLDAGPAAPPVRQGGAWKSLGNGEAIAPPFGLIRQCSDCGCLVAGGQTECGFHLKKAAPPPPPPLVRQGEEHVCKCENEPCPKCGGGPEGEWSEGSEVKCADCGALLVVANIEPCQGRSTFELASTDEEGHDYWDEPPPPVNGGPLVPEGFRLGDGWRVYVGIHLCLHTMECGRRAGFAMVSGTAKRVCIEHAVEAVALVPVEPPGEREQPAEPSARILSNQDSVRATFAEPSAPPGFRVVGRSGPRVTAKGKMVKEARLMSGAQAPARWAAAVCPSEYPGDGGAWNAGCYDILEPIVEPPAPPPVELAKCMCGDPTYDATHRTDGPCFIPVKLTRRPAEPAKGTLSDLLRALYGGTLSGRKFAEQARDLETRLATAEQCWAAALESETAWTVRARDLETKLATAKKERDNAWEESRKLRDHIATRDARIKDLEDSAAALGARANAAEHDEKVIRQRERLAERERCLEIVETYEPRRECPADWSYQGALSVVAARIGEGK